MNDFYFVYLQKIETSESSTDEASLVKKDEKKKGRGRPSGKSSKPEISKDDIDASKVKVRSFESSVKT